MAFVFTKVPISGRKDYVKIEQLMSEAVEKYLQVGSDTVLLQSLIRCHRATSANLCTICRATAKVYQKNFRTLSKLQVYVIEITEF